MIRLMTNDRHEVLVPRNILQPSVMIWSLVVEGYGIEYPILLPEISLEILEKVLEYLRHVAAGNEAPDIEKPLTSSNMRDVTTEFYANYIDLSDDEVSEIINAANFLEIKGLIDLGCAKMGSVIRGLSIQEFRQRFNIENDFTPEEEADPFDEARMAQLQEAYERQSQE